MLKYIRVIATTKYSILCRREEVGLVDTKGGIQSIESFLGRKEIKLFYCNCSIYKISINIRHKVDYSFKCPNILFY